MHKAKPDRVAEAFTRERLITELAESDLPQPFVPAGPVKLIVKACHASPKGLVRKTSGMCERMHSKRPDIDNVLKHVMDAANGVLWGDDTQVVEVRIVQVSSAIPIGGPAEQGYLNIRVEDFSNEEGP